MSTGHPVEKGTTIKYPAVALLCVNSADAETYNKTTGARVDDKTPAQIYINYGKPFLFGYMTRLALTEVNINWATPNVNPLNNNLTIQVDNITEDSTQISRITIPVGFYTPSELAEQVQTQFTDVFGDFLNLGAHAVDPIEVTWSNTTSSFYVLVAEPNGTTNVWNEFSIRILSSSVFRPAGATVPVALPALDYDLTDMMGLTQVEAGGVSFKAITGGYASMLYTPYIDVVSNILTKNQNVQDGDTYKLASSAKLARIYLTNEEIVGRYEKLVPVYNTSGVITSANYETNIIGCRPFCFKREFQFPKQIQWNSTENVDVMDLSVLDYKGNPVYITPRALIDTEEQPDTLQVGNTADFQFTIQATEV